MLNLNRQMACSKVAGSLLSEEDHAGDANTDRQMEEKQQAASNLEEGAAEKIDRQMAVKQSAASYLPYGGGNS